MILGLEDARRRPRSPVRRLSRRGGGQLAGWGDEGDPWIWWPGAISQLKSQVDTEVQAIARYVSAIRKESGTKVISDLKLSEFKDFFNEWGAFRDSLGILGLLTGANVDRMKVFQKRAQAYHAEFTARAQATGSAVDRPTAPGVPAKNDLHSLVKHAGTYLMIAGGAYLAWKVIAETGALRGVLVKRPSAG